MGCTFCCIWMDAVPASEPSVLVARVFIKLPWTQFIAQSPMVSNLATPLAGSEPTSLREWGEWVS